MAAGRTRMVVAVVAGPYVVAQLSGPEAVQLGFASFRVLIPNAPLFFGGLVLGYHRTEIAAWWRGFRWHRKADLALVMVAVTLGWLHVTEYAA